jgi:hypothetical protein
MDNDNRSSAPWNSGLYAEIDSARFDEDANELTVRFADGSVAVLDPAPLIPDDLTDVDWWRVASNRYEIIVPYTGGWFEIPWDVVRRATDADYAAYWEGLSREYASNIGKRIHAIRRRSHLSREDLADRSKITVQDLTELENGAFPLLTDVLRAVLDALQLDRWQLFDDGAAPVHPVPAVMAS